MIIPKMNVLLLGRSQLQSDVRRVPTVFLWLKMGKPPIQPAEAPIAATADDKDRKNRWLFGTITAENVFVFSAFAPFVMNIITPYCTNCKCIFKNFVYYFLKLVRSV
jgi:hypothetical protein